MTERTKIVIHAFYGLIFHICRISYCLNYETNLKIFDKRIIHIFSSRLSSHCVKIVWRDKIFDIRVLLSHIPYLPNHVLAELWTTWKISDRRIFSPAFRTNPNSYCILIVWTATICDVRALWSHIQSLPNLVLGELLIKTENLWNEDYLSNIPHKLKFVLCHYCLKGGYVI